MNTGRLEDRKAIGTIPRYSRENGDPGLHLSSGYPPLPMAAGASSITARVTA
jgi:hypothetical protein